MTKQETKAKIINYILEGRKQGMIKLCVKKDVEVYQSVGEDFFVYKNGLIANIDTLSYNELKTLLRQIINWME